MAGCCRAASDEIPLRSQRPHLQPRHYRGERFQVRLDGRPL